MKIDDPLENIADQFLNTLKQTMKKTNKKLNKIDDKLTKIQKEEDIIKKDLEEKEKKKKSFIF